MWACQVTKRPRDREIPGLSRFCLTCLLFGQLIGNLRVSSGEESDRETARPIPGLSRFCLACLLFGQLSRNVAGLFQDMFSQQKKSLSNTTSSTHIMTNIDDPSAVS